MAWGQACATCDDQKSDKNLSALSKIAKSALSQDVGKFCNDTAWGALDYSNTPHTIKDAKTIQERKHVADRFKVSRGFGYQGPWEDSLVPNMNFRGSLFQKICKRHPYCGDISTMREFIKGPKEIPFQIQRALGAGAYHSTDETSEKFDQKLSSQTFVKAVACAGVNLLSSLECAKGLDKIIDYAKPMVGYKGANVTGVSSYQKILDKKYVKGAQRAALLVLDRFEKSSVEPGANIFDDIYQSYRKEGMSHEEADDAAWEILAIIGAGGPNAGPRFVSFASTPELEPLKWAISAMAIAIPKLDLMSTTSGHPYSMPKEITTTCDIGKPYHFWMTAYLSRKLVKEGISPKGAASAAFVAQKAYEVKSTTSGRDPNRVFMTDSYGAWNNVLRIDTAFSSAGAIFGANHARKSSRKINVDDGLKKIIRSGSFQPKLTESQSKALCNKLSGAAAYYRWNQIINADAAFDLHLNQLED